MRLTMPSVLLATALLAGAAGAGAAQTPHLVVLEMFTAQGCSSCPPADRLLAKLGDEQPALVVPLSFHVDYWNSQGWIDPFSNPAWTRRQQFYVRLLGSSGVYTPQTIVDGSMDLVGADEAALRAAIARAATLPAATVELSVAPGESAVSVDALVTVPETLRSRKLDVMVAVYETGLETPVKRGENGGKTLRDDYVVRTLRRAQRLEGKGSEPARVTITLPLGKEWKRANLGVAVFVQDARALSIHGAASAPLAAIGRSASRNEPAAGMAR